MNNEHSNPGRRRFLQAVAVAAGAVVTASPARVSSTPSDANRKVPAPSQPGLPDGLKLDNFIEHSRSPLALEVRRSRIGSGAITPVSRFFVRNNLPMPAPSIITDADHWQLEVGGVNRPGSISLAQLKGLGLDMEAAVIQCSGNGRRFFEHAPAGSRWGTGAAGCALWAGVRVSQLLEHFGGARSGMGLLTATGGETLPEGIARDQLIVERSIPLHKAENDALLAWEMNGAPIPLVHGGPLRLIVPGYYGVNNIKYVKHIACTKTESPAKIQQSGYRLRSIGDKGGPDQPSMWRMPVKSWVNGPGADDAPALAGAVTFYGVALSGERGVDKVEVSLDGGQHWREATLEQPDLGPNAWRVFSFTTTLPPGRHTIVSRATDRQGESQPRERADNERGYGHNGWHDAALTVTLLASLPEREPVEDEATPAADTEARPAEQVTLSEAAQSGRQLFRQGAEPPCGTCHSLAEAGTQGLVGPNLDQLQPDAATLAAAISGGVGVMPAYANTLSAEQIEALVAYVIEASQ